MVKLFSPLKYAFEDQEFEILNSIKVFSIAMIVLGNTFYFIFNGPVRNLEDSSEWFDSTIFSFILMADLQSDIFFFITAFTWSYQMLKTF